MAIWLRVSSDDQKLDSQSDAGERYVQARDWQVVMRFIEQGVSGSAQYRKVVDEVLGGGSPSPVRHRRDLPRRLVVPLRREGLPVHRRAHRHRMRLRQHRGRDRHLDAGGRADGQDGHPDGRVGTQGHPSPGARGHRGRAAPGQATSVGLVGRSTSRRRRSSWGGASACVQRRASSDSPIEPCAAHWRGWRKNPTARRGAKYAEGQAPPCGTPSCPADPDDEDSRGASSSPTRAPRPTQESLRSPNPSFPSLRRQKKSRRTQPSRTSSPRCALDAWERGQAHGEPDRAARSSLARFSSPLP